MAPRGRGGKFSKPSRGGGKHFSRDLQPVDKDGNTVGLWREPDDDIPSSSSDSEEDSESGSEEESGDDNAKAGSSSQAAAEMTREERRAAAKAKKQAAMAKRNKVQPGDLPPSSDESGDNDDELPANPNHTTKSRSQLETPSSDKPKSKPTGDLSQLSRREREAIEAQQARERYMKLHAEGKTDEARSDLARLAIIREKREAERARKEVEKEEKAEQAKQKITEREIKMREAAKGGKKPGSKKK